MNQRTKEAARHIDVVLRALDILDCFQDDVVLSLKEIIDRTGLTRNRVMRLIGTLESRGYITENRERRLYCPGIKLSILGKSFEMINDINAIRKNGHTISKGENIPDAHAIEYDQLGIIQKR